MAPTKPVLRNTGKRAWAICVVSSLVASSAFAVWFKTYVVEARKQHYIDFYKNYDSDKVYEAQKKAGIFKGFEL